MILEISLLLLLSALIALIALVALTFYVFVYPFIQLYKFDCYGEKY